MKKSIRRSLPVLALFAFAACEPSDSIVSRADRNELTVPEVMTLLLGVQLPNDQNVTYTVAELWVDYTLLATAMADDSTGTKLDVRDIVAQQVEQELLLKLRDEDVKPDTSVTDEEVDQRFAQTAPGVRLKARHVFLSFPQNPTQAQRDSVRTVANGLLARIRAGENFEAIARQYSNDARTAVEGGDLGYFGHGELMGPLETAAFALQPRQVSDVVESIYGVHILRVDERQTPTLDDVRPTLRTQIQQERMIAAESTLVASVEADANIEIQDGASDLARRIADDPGVDLSRRARARELVRYRGGALRVSDIVTFMQGRNTEFRLQIYQANDDAIEQNLLLALVQRKLVSQRALERGMEIPEARQDSLTHELQTRIVAAARELGLINVERREGEALREAIDRRVTDVLREMLGGTRDVVPLGSFSFVLREQYPAQVYPLGVARVMARIRELRPDSTAAQPGAAGAPSPSITVPPPTVPSPPATGAPAPAAPSGPPAP